jgi:CelD/BcsL family acetyltransferase involved in cellulose biosynthesis
MSAVAEFSGLGASPALGERVGWRARAVTLAEVEREWRGLERTGIATPYQRFDWVKAYAEQALGAEQRRLGLVRIGAPDGRALALLPFAMPIGSVSRCAAFVGGKHANFHMGVYDRDFAAALTAAEAAEMLQQAAKALGGLDCFGLINQPQHWDGVPNPLARLSTRPSNEPAYRLTLSEAVEDDLLAALSNDARKKQRSKRSKLQEMGELRSFIAQTPGEIDAALTAFHAQKAARFARLGLANPFAAPEIKAFLAAATQPQPDGADGDGPPLRIAALTLNGAVIASFIGAVHAGRWSGMATAFSADESLAKHSPGDLLLTDVVRLEHALGTRIIDLGVGEARYKASLCKEQDALVDSFVPVSTRGRAFAALSQQLQGAKLRIKSSPLAYRLAQRAHAALGRLKPRPSPAGPA